MYVYMKNVYIKTHWKILPTTYYTSNNKHIGNDVKKHNDGANKSNFICFTIIFTCFFTK